MIYFLIFLLTGIVCGFFELRKYKNIPLFDKFNIIALNISGAFVYNFLVLTSVFTVINTMNTLESFNMWTKLGAEAVNTLMLNFVVYVLGSCFLLLLWILVIQPMLINKILSKYQAKKYRRS